MNRQVFRILIALFLIGLGVVFLLNNLNMLPFSLDNVQWFWAAVFGLGGLAFLWVFLTSRENWWAVIPSFTLLGLAAIIGFERMLGAMSGAVFLGMIGLSFWLIFFTHRENWWAIIPGGVLLTLALVVVTEAITGDSFATGGLFFLGLAATFMVVYMLPTPEGRMTWAIWPAGALGALGLLTTIGAGGAAKYIWPAALILVGVFLVSRAVLPKRL